MPYGNPWGPDLLGTVYTPASKTGTNTTKTALASITIPAYKLQLGAVIKWEAYGQVTLNTANRNVTMSVELGSFASYNTTHSRSGSNHGLVITTIDPSGRQVLANGTTSTATDFHGHGVITVTAAPGSAVTCRGGGFVHLPGVDQGGTPAPSAGFDTDGNNSGTVNTTTSNTLGFYVQWATGTQVLDVVTLNAFYAVQFGYQSPL